MDIGGYIGAQFGIDFLSIAHAFTMISGQPMDELLSCVSRDVTAVNACLIAKDQDIQNLPRFDGCSRFANRAEGLPSLPLSLFGGLGEFTTRFEKLHV